MPLSMRLRGSVPVLMVNIGGVGMCMGDRVMHVPVTVTALRHHIVGVGVVSVIVTVGMLMSQCLVRMLMSVALSQMQEHTCQHETAPQQH